jgi:amino acid permease
VSRTLRNVLIVFALAAAVAFMPGGGKTAAFISALLSTGIAVIFTMLAVRFYREHRTTIYGLGDRHRGLLYGALAAIVLALAGRDRLLDSGVGALLFFVLLGGAAFALYAVWQHHRSYGY